MVSEPLFVDLLHTSPLCPEGSILRERKQCLKLSEILEPHGFVELERLRDQRREIGVALEVESEGFHVNGRESYLVEPSAGGDYSNVSNSPILTNVSAYFH